MWDDGAKVYLAIAARNGNPIFWVRLFSRVGFGIGRIDGKGWPRLIWWHE